MGIDTVIIGSKIQSLNTIVKIYPLVDELISLIDAHLKEALVMWKKVVKDY